MFVKGMVINMTSEEKKKKKTQKSPDYIRCSSGYYCSNCSCDCLDMAQV